MKRKDVLFRFGIIKLVLHRINLIIILSIWILIINTATYMVKGDATWGEPDILNQHQQKVNQGLQECGLPQKYEISF